MTKRRITKVAFTIADIVCWLMVGLSVATLVSAFFPPHFSTWSVMGLPASLLISLEVTNSVLNGFGYYLLLKRKAAGFIFIFVTNAFSLAAVKYFHVQTIYYILALFVVVALPWVLVSKEVVNAQKT